MSQLRRDAVILIAENISMNSRISQAQERVAALLAQLPAQHEEESDE